MSATPIMNWPVRVKRMKAKNAARAATVAPIAGRSQPLTAISPTSVTGQKIVGKIVCGQVPKISIAT